MRFSILILAALLLTSTVSAEIVGVNEAANVPQHPEYRLRNLAHRTRGWNGHQLTLTAGADPMLPGLANPSITPESLEYRYNDRAGIILRDTKLNLQKPTVVYVEDMDAEHADGFRKAFIDDLRRFDVWRTMDLSKTNGNTQTHWNDRPTPNSPIGEWFEKGWPWEMQIEAANAAEVDLWVCVPHMASDNYVHEMGKLFAANLDPERTVYLEYTSEAWNTGPAFEQSRWIVNNLAGGKWSERHRAYGKRAGEVWRIFKDAAPNSKLRRVLSGQAASVRVIEEAFAGASDVDGRPDVVSCAAYFNPGKDVERPKEHVLFEHFKQHGEDNDFAFELMVKSIRDRSVWWKSYGGFADDLDVPLIAYEGGSHIAADGKQRSDADYVEWLHKLNRDPRMLEIYKLLRETWRDAGGDGILYFQRLAGDSPFGSWGHREFTGDDSPKNQAIDQHIAEAKTDPEPDPEPQVILELADGGLGNAKDWLGRPASRYTKATAKTFEFDSPIRPPLTISAQVARVGIRDGYVTNPEGKREKIFGMASVVRLWSTEHGGFMTLDHCEPNKPAGRTRSVEYRLNPDGSKKKLPNGKLDIVGLQNGSTPANDPVNKVHLLANNQRGRWHHLYGVFNPDDFRPYRSDVDNLWCYLDDNGRSIQGADTDPEMSREFNRITIGAGDPGSACTLFVRALKIESKVGTRAESMERARSLQLTFTEADWYDESTWPDDDRYATLSDEPTPDPEPDPEPDTERGSYVRRFEGGEEVLILTPEAQ